MENEIQKSEGVFRRCLSRCLQRAKKIVTNKKASAAYQSSYMTGNAGQFHHRLRGDLLQRYVFLQKGADDAMS